MKVELKIEAPGVQVYAYEINEEAKNLLQENANNGFPIGGMEIVEEHATVTLISNGIAARDNGCKYTVSINGDEKPFYPALFEWFETEDFENPDCIKDTIEMSNWPDTVDPEDYVWIPAGEGSLFKHTPGSEDPIPEGHTVIFEIIPYSSGTLHTSFEVDDDFKLTDLKIITDDPDMNDYDLAWLYYCDVFGSVLDQNEDKPFDEDTIRAVDYNGERHDFNLDFQGGSGWYEAHEKGEDGWYPSFLVNGWLDEG